MSKEKITKEQAKDCIERGRELWVDTSYKLKALGVLFDAAEEIPETGILETFHGLGRIMHETEKKMAAYMDIFYTLEDFVEAAEGGAA